MMNLKLLISFMIFICHCDCQMIRKEAYKTVPQLITDAGYPVERHRVRTEDGYSLQMHRIPAGRRSPRRTGEVKQKGKKAVLICHGLLGSSGDFIIMGPDRSLGYMLADAGYDVWLANLRGTAYSGHQNMTRRDPKFWDFSFHEHGKYDLPSLIEKVLNVSGLAKVLYIGYSMGATSFFTMVSQKPEMNEKIVSFLAMAPAVYMDNIKPLAELGLKTMNFPNTMRSRGVYSMTVRSDLLDMFVGGFCNVRQPHEDICLRVLYSIVGEDYEQNDWNMTTVILTRFQPASWKQLEHFGKIAMTGEFIQLSTDSNNNLIPYNLTNVRVPVQLLYGENDQLTEKSRIKRLGEVLRKNGVLHGIRPGTSWPKFNHLDFVFAKDVHKLVNKRLIKDLDLMHSKYNEV